MCGQSQAAQTRSESYESAKPKLQGVAAKIRDYIERVGTGSATTVAKEIGESILTVRPAFTRLKQAGAIQETGLRYTTEAGKNEVVYRLNPYWDGSVPEAKEQRVSVKFTARELSLLALILSASDDDIADFIESQRGKGYQETLNRETVELAVVALAFEMYTTITDAYEKASGKPWWDYAAEFQA